MDRIQEDQVRHVVVLLEDRLGELRALSRGKGTDLMRRPMPIENDEVLGQELIDQAIGPPLDLLEISLERTVKVRNDLSRRHPGQEASPHLGAAPQQGIVV